MKKLQPARLKSVVYNRLNYQEKFVQEGSNFYRLIDYGSYSLPNL